MKKQTQFLYVLLATVLLIVACSATNEPYEPENPPRETLPNEQPDDKENDDSIDDNSDVDENQVESEDIDLAQFFLSDGSKMHYKGEGNEFAELDVEVHKSGDQYVVIDENNGGVLIRKIYRITDEQIIILSEDAINLSTPLPDEETIELHDFFRSLPGQKLILLSSPIK